MKKLIISQFIILSIGTLFAWTNFVKEFIAWQNNKPCKTGCTFNIDGAFPVATTPTIPNPFLTPCFYGAIFFTIAFILGLFILKKYIRRQ